MMRNMGSSQSPKGIAAIVGVGPNLGRSIARKFAHEGYILAILSRDLGRLSRFADEIAREEKAQVFAIRIDCSDTKSIREAFEGVLSLGFVEVLVYNAYHPASPSHFTDIRLPDFEKSVVVSSVGAFHCAQQVLPGMVERGRGTILFTGCYASLNGMAGYSDLCCGKFALRALSQCLAREFQPQGVHVAHVIIDGIVAPPPPPRSASSASVAQSRSTSSSSVGEQEQQQQQQKQRHIYGAGGEGTLDPDVLAQTYWQLHIQDRSAWTQEIDLRPSNSSRLF
ncbi:OLC1v1010118C1 [Oldenlandia corymbosa var. corymbosa]|uniref:OLC1v1010118C1 n=1 Tax=Oldenlandia corymbosa var. corymbosa TaxID=529605 RepID=A0AAV1DQL2_OLDCO|nr:OLC1v1010118C1 [Oldenlandia corymbosa var. corymbosa]